MKLDEGEAIVGVQICTEKHDVLLTSAHGQCIRFPVPDVRVFQGRTSMGVRGIQLAEGDKVISMSILRHLDASAEERVAYLKRANAVRRGTNGEADEAAAAEGEETAGAIELGEQRYVEM
jgi:DNA gyrase subunit A